MIRDFLYLVAALAAIALGWGIVAPYLVSSTSDIGVVLGFGAAILVPIYLMWLHTVWRAGRYPKRKRQHKYGR